MALEPRVTDAIVLGEDIECHEKEGAGHLDRVFRSGVFRRLEGEIGGDPSDFSRFLALLRFGAVAALEVSSHLPGCMLIPRIASEDSVRG